MGAACGCIVEIAAPVHPQGARVSACGFSGVPKAIRYTQTRGVTRVAVCSRGGQGSA